MKILAPSSRCIRKVKHKTPQSLANNFTFMIYQRLAVVEAVFERGKLLSGDPVVLLF